DVFGNAGCWEFHEKEYTAQEFHAMLVEAGFAQIALFGQCLTDRGQDRAELRSELARLELNPLMRFGRFLQRTLRRRQTERAILPERVDDFHFVPLGDKAPWNGVSKVCEAFVGVAVR